MIGLGMRIRGGRAALIIALVCAGCASGPPNGSASSSSSGMAPSPPSPPSPSPPPPPVGEQVVVGFYEGMTIRTANAYGNVEVRAMSYGPGLCTTHITVGDRTVNFAAPPAVYSGWVVANSHTGSRSFVIGKRDQCDTGTEVQVRYWKQ